jgi:PAS domain S-box-containing protein
MTEEKRILIVDDDENTCKSLKLIFETRGYETETALTGKEALEEAQKKPVNLALLDLRLPDMEGVELLEALKAMQPDMAMVMVTGYASVGSVVQALEAGASAYITKPLDMEEVLTRVGSILERRHRILERQLEEEALRERNRQLELLSRAVEAFSSTLELDQVLSQVLNQTCNLLDVTAASVWLIDAEIASRGESSANLVCRLAVGPNADLVRGWRLASGQGIAGWVASHGESIIVPDVCADDRHFEGVDKQTRVELRSLLSVPMRLKGKVIGVIQVVDTAVGRFGPLELKLLESLAASAAVATENARLFEQIQRELGERMRAEKEAHLRNRELTLLNRIIAASATDLDPISILEVACRELARAFDVPQAAAALLNEEKTAAVAVAEYLTEGREPGLNAVIPVRGNPSFEHLLTYKTPLAVENAQHDPRLTPIHDLMRQRGTISLLILPLIVEGEVVGSLGLDAIQPRHFTAGEVSLAWSVADQVSGALARAEMSQTLHRLSTAIEQTAEGVVILDTSGAIVYVNPAFEQITGYGRDEAVGQSMDILRSGGHDQVLFEEMRASLDAGRVWHGRVVNKRKDGTLYTDETTVTPVRNESGTIVNYVQVKRDVTRELELEEQYRQAQKMEAVGQLTAGIAHDFNNLLTAINGFAELLQFELSLNDPRHELVDRILDSGRRAADLVRQLLAFSRKQIIQPRVLDLNQVVVEMDRLLGPIIGEDIDLKTNLEPDLWPIQVDPAQIEQVIVNLAVNARDAMPSGGKLTIETANMILDEDYVADHLGAQPGEHVVLSVSDSGAGMNEEVKARIFEPFFTTKERGKGSGLGLATVYGIIKQSNGHIWVYSEERKGTTFKIYLPRSGEVGPESQHPEFDQDVPTGGETVMLVEDKAEVRDLARRVLLRQGYRVLEAEDGQEALELAAHHRGPIHLLLSDVVMPGMSGQTLAASLVSANPDLRTLFISGYTDEAVARHGVLGPDVAFLQKPFGPMDLACKIREILDEPQHQDEHAGSGNLTDCS